MPRTYTKHLQVHWKNTADKGLLTITIMVICITINVLPHNQNKIMSFTIIGILRIIRNFNT